MDGLAFTVARRKYQDSIPLKKETLSEYFHDLLLLEDINEASVLYNIKHRFDRNRIYTRLGKILITVNPYQLFPLYSNEIIDKYAMAGSTLPPHVYEIAKEAFDELTKMRRAQSILITGESGAGKTEACKQCMHFLTEIASTENADTDLDLNIQQ